ncbi:hypothetical protein NHX12_032776 [Muraenolepis orangiensis]|uniref:Uncharacterized protein n=1 Tax=Muraenolepis orangiensis TaxID=630683 RepID=A0A9Q0IFR2_9TELE|nr:hypothetical protein NHX12_032776 [Muraenolepis orangiensis]
MYPTVHKSVPFYALAPRVAVVTAASSEPRLAATPVTGVVAVNRQVPLALHSLQVNQVVQALFRGPRAGLSAGLGPGHEKSPPGRSPPVELSVSITPPLHQSTLQPHGANPSSALLGGRCFLPKGLIVSLGAGMGGCGGWGGGHFLLFTWR